MTFEIDGPLGAADRSEPKYAVYVLVVEDTEANHQDLALRCESMERVDGDLTISEAENLLNDIVYDGRNL